MAKKIFITGDTHGVVAPRIDQLIADNPELNPEDMALIILGDVGLNYYLGKKDRKNKEQVEERGVYIYCVYGNHEARPGEHLGMECIDDETVGGSVWYEKDFPHIRYFTVWGVYNIQGLETLVIGGAYSVDKYYRLSCGYQWFEDEQLKDFERAALLRSMWMCNFDLVLSHTCPMRVQPTDLFLGCIDQSTVDNSTEKWLDELSENITWKIWLFGHYHADRIEWPYVEQFYTEIEPLDDIVERWTKYDETGELDWWLPISPRLRRIIKPKILED